MFEWAGIKLVWCLGGFFIKYYGVVNSLLRDQLDIYMLILWHTSHNIGDRNERF